MTNYRRGADFERAVKAHLEGHGYLVVRTAGSHGVMDLIAYPQNVEKGNRPWFVQCKTNGRMDPKERGDLWTAARRAGAIAVKASRPKRGAILFERYFPLGNVSWGGIEP